MRTTSMTGRPIFVNVSFRLPLLAYQRAVTEADISKVTLSEVLRTATLKGMGMTDEAKPKRHIVLD